MTRKTKLGRRSLMVLVSAAFLPAGSVLAQTSQWVGGTSDWNTAANWSPGGVPGNGDNVDVTSTLGMTQAVTYDYPGPAVTLGSLTIDLTGGSGGTGEILVMAGNSLSASGSETVGDSGAGVFNQSGGTNNSTEALNIGLNAGSIGTYSLSGAGTLSVGGSEVVGYNGTGIFNQSGGTDTVSSNFALYIGGGGTSASNGSAGTYNLSGTGVLTVNQDEYVGDYGTGIFNQSGGTHTDAGLLIGDGGGCTGTYTLSGTGSLSVGGAVGECVGYVSTGFFNQTGGTNIATELGIGVFRGAIGSFALSGGTLAVNGDADVGGSELFGVGADGTLTVSNSGQMNVSGMLQVYGNGDVNISGTVPEVGSLCISTGGLVNINSALLITSDGGSPATVEAAIQKFIEGGAITTTAAGMDVAYADGSDPGLEDSNLLRGQVVIEPDYAGDTDLSGTVAFHDLQILLGNFGQPGFWDQGNFNGHATVDFNDLQLLLGNFNDTASLSYSELAGIENLVGEFGDVAVANSDGTGFILTGVPEPASVGMVAVGACLLAQRRRRRRASRRREPVKSDREAGSGTTVKVTL
jgi:hypothetical protein